MVIRNDNLKVVRLYLDDVYQFKIKIEDIREQQVG